MESKTFRPAIRSALSIPLLVLGLALLSQAGWAPPLAACSCVQTFPAGTQPCAAYASAGAVFVGRVLEIETRRPEPTGDETEDEESYPHRVVTLAVDEPFRGVSTSTVDVVTGMGGGDCGYHFQVGESYFVYASRWPEDGPLRVGICGSTTRLGNAGADLDYARRLARGDEVPGIYGVVSRESRESVDGGIDREPLAGVEVTVTGPGLEPDPEPVRLETDARGFFQVVGHLSGVYVVTAEATGIPPVTVEVPASGCAEASPTASETGRIEGVLLTAEGEPVSEAEVTLMEAQNPQATMERRTDENGRFSLSDVPPGSYLLAVNPEGPLFEWDPPYAPLFHPAGASAEEAVPIAVAAGETVTVEPMRLGPPLPTRTIHGRLTRADGQPLGTGRVAISPPGGGYARLGAEVDAEGRFTATVYAGRAYRIEAEDWRAGRVNAAAETRVEVWEDDVTVDLVLEIVR